MVLKHMVLPTKEIVNIVKTNNMSYILSYVLIGVLLSFIFDMLNEFVLYPKDKIKFGWGTRIINTIIWPYILGVFIRSIVNYYR